MINDEIVESGLGELRDRVGRLERGLAENTAATKRIESSTSELVEFFADMKGAFRVLEMVGKAAKPLAAITGLCVAVGGAWATFKGYFK